MLAALLSPQTNLRGADTPAASLSTTVSVADFGAEPDDGKDDTLAIVKAIDACKQKGAGKLIFPRGQYEVSAEAITVRPKGLLFAGFSSFTIDGQGSTLMFTGLTSAFLFNRSQGISIRNLNIDWARPPFSQGTVVGVDGQTFDLKVDDAYPVTGNEKFQGVMDYHPVTRLPLGNMQLLANSGIISCRLIGPQLLRLEIKTSLNAAQAEHYRKTIAQLTGKLIVLRHVIYGNYGFDFVNCKDVSLEDINVYTIPGMGLHAQTVENISLRRVGIRIRPGSGRMLSTTADGQYYTHCSGLISVEDSWSEGTGDDCFNACAKYKTITKIVSPSSIEAHVEGRTWRGPTPKPGEVLEFADAETLEVHGLATVKACRWDDSIKAFRIDFEQPLPVSVTARDFFASKTYLPKVRISNSTFKSGAARGLLFSTRDVVVENCKIEAHTYAGIMLMGGRRSAFQGPANENVVIRGNTISDCGGTAIYADASVSNPAAVHSNITIENNIIKGNAGSNDWHFKHDQPDWMYWNAALCLTAVKNVQLRNNSISGYRTAFFLNYAEQVAVAGNTLATPAPFYLGQKTQGVTQTGNTLLPDAAVRESSDSQINFLQILR